MVGLLPACLSAALGWYAADRWKRREVPHNLPLALAKVAGGSLMEGHARFLYPGRVETPRLVMFHHGRVADPGRDAEAMDRHVAALEALTGMPLRAKIYWVRGKALGQGGLAFGGLALGSSESPADWQAGGYVDRHELAHAVLYQHYGPDTDPPMLLVEGWAESQSRDGHSLVGRALEARRRRAAGESWAAWREPGGTCLGGLTGPTWYHQDSGPVYDVGGAFVDFLLRRGGAGRFVELYFTCGEETFGADCRRVYGADLDTLEKEFWDDVGRRAEGR